MNANDLDQRLNFFLIAQRLGATLAPIHGPGGEGIGMSSAGQALRQMQTATSSDAFPVPELAGAQLEALFQEACGRRWHGPEALLWSKEAAREFFHHVTARLGDFPRREITRRLLEAHRDKRHSPGFRQRRREAGWGWPRPRSPGYEAAVEWALCRIRYTCGYALPDILDLICDPQLGEAYWLLARAMAPEGLREVPEARAASLLFEKAYRLHGKRGHVRRRSFGDEPAGIQELIKGRLTSFADIRKGRVPKGHGLVQLNDGERCVFVCYAGDVSATAAEIARGSALYLLARNYWGVDPATLRIGFVFGDEVANVSIAGSRDARYILRKMEKLLIATLQPTFNWPVMFSDTRRRQRDVQ
jgi:hypothetical protein